MKSANTHSVQLAGITGAAMPWLHRLFHIIVAQADHPDAAPGLANFVNASAALLFTHIS